MIKLKYPEMIIIFGGPNYPTVEKEQERFLRAYPQVDFYISKEGEIGFTTLINSLLAVDFDAKRVPNNLPSVRRSKFQGRQRLREQIFRAPKWCPAITEVAYFLYARTDCIFAN